MPTEKEIIRMIKRGKLSFPPLSICLLQTEPFIEGKYRPDALIRVSWGEKKAEFYVELKSISTPKIFQSAINQLKSLSLRKSIGRMLIMPFLNDKQLQELEREGISGLDLCGNGIVVVPGVFSVYRRGERNRFPSSDPIKNIYRKNSSMVGRVFLRRSSYNTVNDICEEINNLNMLVNRWEKKPMNISTVSKALKTLEDDLIIERKNTIRLLQGDKLLENLIKNYAGNVSVKKTRFRIEDKNKSIIQLLRKISRKTGTPFVATGVSSVSQYAVMRRSNILSVYCPGIERIIDEIPGDQTDRFPNLEILETEDETVYFDARENQDFWWASPVQVYLELMAGDKRDQEAAEQVKSYILKNLAQEKQ